MGSTVITAINTNQVKCWFLRRGETGVPGENLSVQSRELRTNKLNPHMTPDLGIEPGPHWWEASALTTAPSLHPKVVSLDRIWSRSIRFEGTDIIHSTAKDQLNCLHSQLFSSFSIRIFFMRPMTPLIFRSDLVPKFDNLLKKFILLPKTSLLRSSKVTYG